MSNKKEQAKESKRQRAERIANSSNGMTMRTRVVPSKKKYDRREANKLAFKD
jgi:hypothetical protein